MGAAGSPWPLIHAERKALLDDLEGVGLTPGVWGTTSLCTAWDVHQVLGHMLSTAMMTPPRFLMEMAKAGFRFPRFAEAGVAAWTKGTPQETIAAFRAVQARTTAPPGPVEAMLGEAVVHPEDIRRPLGLRRVYPEEALVRTADFFKGSNLLIGAKNRIAGLRLKADDVDWSHGEGPEVRGPMLALVMTMTGRSAHLADLGGEGLPGYRARFDGST
ncbi:maleylpyruvate isomerase family mycothiol-dependent enzyme [Streptacidiphilus sp. MAP12-33]|uniref:maleylpyruvate isomerase family mycothiol-dependent enzyme n=1 Tax=Streptacidiphilus sp. MAP12-33 TaxID=3156266 RepID=UPI003516A611